MRKRSPTVEELKALLIARFNAERSEQVELQARLQQELGNEVREEESEVVTIANEVADQIFGVLARRLKRNRRTTPLLSSRGFVRLIPLVINEIAEAVGIEPEAEERKVLEKFMKTIFEYIFETMHAMVPPGKDLYEEYWRWVTTVLDLAAERDIPPTELLALESVIDEVTRRMFTKEQFVALFERAAVKFIDVDVLRGIVQPMLDMVAIEATEEERRELEERKTELEPRFRETVEKSRVIVNAWFGEKVERIYAVT